MKACVALLPTLKTNQRVLDCVGPRSEQTEHIDNILCRNNPLAMLDVLSFAHVIDEREDCRLQQPLTCAARSGLRILSRVASEAVQGELDG